MSALLSNNNNGSEDMSEGKASANIPDSSAGGEASANNAIMSGPPVAAMTPVHPGARPILPVVNKIIATIDNQKNLCEHQKIGQNKLHSFRTTVIFGAPEVQTDFWFELMGILETHFTGGDGELTTDLKNIVNSREMPENEYFFVPWGSRMVYSTSFGLT